MNTQVSNQSASASVAFNISHLALKNIEPSGTAVQARRRSRYDAAALKELAQNIKAVHVIEPIVVRCVIHAMSVHSFTACRSSISRDAGHRFHAMPVQHFTACRSSS